MKKTENRIQYKTILLTYSQIDNCFRREDFLKHLQKITKRWNLEKYIIAFEHHQDGGLHCHALIDLSKKPDIKTMSYFDILKNGINYHPNIKRVLFGSRVEYVIKEDKEYLFSSNIDIKQIVKNNFNKKVYENMVSTLIDILKETKNIHRALDYFQENASSLTVGLYGIKIRKALENAEKLFNRRDLVVARFPNSHYKRSRSIETALSQFRPLWLSGRPQTRKTNKIQAECAERNIPAFLFRTEDSLKNQDIRLGDVIIADDSAIHTILKDREHVIQFFDSEHDRVLKARYSDIKIPAGVPVIVLSNEKFINFLGRYGCENDKALISRVVDSHIEEDFKIEININIVGENNQVNLYLNKENRPFIQENSTIVNREAILSGENLFFGLDKEIRTS